MKIHLVGTGSIGAEERSASTLIDDKILIDCGNGIIKTLKQQGKKVDDIKVILITHLHGDHFFDLPFLILDRFFQGVTEELKIYCPMGTEERIKQLMKLAFENDNYEERKAQTKMNFIEFEELQNKEVFDGYFVTSKPVKHGKIKPAYGFIVKHDGKAVGFSGDSSYCDAINEIVENSDISVLDMSGREGNPSHMGIDDIEKICNKYRKKIIATHMQTKTREIAQEKNINGLIIPRDGDEIICGN